MDLEGLCFSTTVQPALPVDEIIVTGLGLGGRFYAECWRADGTLRWRDVAKNIIPNTALNNVLDVYFRQQANTAAFYVGMVDNAGFSAFAAGDTMASHAGWTESTACSNSVRPTWTPTAAASQVIANSTTADFNINATATIKGFFMSSSSAFSTAGTLVATAALGTPQACASGDTLKIVYQIAGTTT